MTVRDTLVAALRAWAGRYDEDIAPGTPEQMADAYRAEVLAEAKTETVAWLVKKAAEQSSWDAGILASKVDRGAVRAFLPTGHYRDAMDAHRAEVLAEAAAELDRIADIIEAGTGSGAQMLRDAAGNLRYMAGQDACEGEPATPAADFYQPGHSYSHRDGRDFHCIAVTTHPNTGERRALGWIARNGWHEPTAMDPDDWATSDGCEPPTGGADGGMTPGELLLTPKGTAYCATPGCGHGDNVHGPFCFASGCGCPDFKHAGGGR